MFLVLNCTINESQKDKHTSQFKGFHLVIRLLLASTEKNIEASIM